MANDPVTDALVSRLAHEALLTNCLTLLSRLDPSGYRALIMMAEAAIEELPGGQFHTDDLALMERVMRLRLRLLLDARAPSG